jgi:hypothetical protein
VPHFWPVLPEVGILRSTLRTLSDDSLQREGGICLFANSIDAARDNKIPHRLNAGSE